MTEQTNTLTILGAMHALDGSGYYRFVVPFGALETESHHIVGLVPPGNPPFRSGEDVSMTDVLTMQRPATKMGVRVVEQYVGKLAVVYETDDDMMNADSSALPHLKDPRMLETIRRCIRLCDLVTTSTPYLADQVRPVNPNVVVVPNCVEDKLLRNAVHWKSEMDPDRPLKVGWAGGSSHLIDWVPYADGLRSVIRDNDDVAFQFAGFDYSPLLGDLRARTTWSGWEDDIGKHYRIVAGFDIGLAPLADEQFNRSKSHLKALEYAAVGIPTIATDMEPYHDFVIDGKTGFLVHNGDEMAARLRDLINDKAMRDEMGAAAREVAAEWTIQNRWREFEAAYEQAHTIFTSER